VTDASRSTRVYAFHGVRICCSCDGAIAAALDARLGRFPSRPDGPYDLRFEYGPYEAAGAASEPTPEGARPIYDADMGEVLYSDASDRVYVSCPGRGRVVCDLRAGRVDVRRERGPGEDVWLMAHPFFTLALLESLKRRGLYSVHAAGVAAGDRILLFPGTSGAGKSTLTLALLREGFGFLSDDMLFLARGRDGLRALAFPESVDVKDDSLRLFPELSDVLGQDPRPGWPKRQVRAEERFGASVVWEGRPAALVFPRVAHAERSVIEPMDQGEALQELVPNILLTEPGSSQAHLDALAELARTCGCYRLETGSDFGEIARQLRSLPEVRG